ncbi:hypothetical protein [Streptococcus minor]|uniref:hypothetical protein n=1 Tax=Streptococcus minor TaxID=229549 RepID=UPI00035D334B|nr:hypothetical protein [Streptococcus minor]MDO5078169.1 bacteriocin immunity protein [Streptococcus minor]
MFLTNSRQKRDGYYRQIEQIYNNKHIIISSKLRKELLSSAKGLQNGEQISYLAYKLYPFVCDEILENKSNKNELIILKKYLEKTRWKYYWGTVLGMAFVRS